jgi:hypothetical protein
MVLLCRFFYCLVFHSGYTERQSTSDLDDKLLAVDRAISFLSHGEKQWFSIAQHLGTGRAPLGLPESLECVVMRSFCNAAIGIKLCLQVHSSCGVHAVQPAYSESQQNALFSQFLMFFRLHIVSH